MNGIKKIICLCAALLAVLTGLFLPEAAFWRYNERLIKKTGAYAMDTVKLKAAAQVADSLRLAAGNYDTYVKLNRGEKLDGEKAYTAAVTGLKKMTEGMAGDGSVMEGCFGDPGTGAETMYKATPYLLVSSDQPMSAVVWECILYSDRAWCRTLVDDASGRLLTFCLQFQEPEAQEAADRENREENRAALLADHAAVYYALEIAAVEPADPTDITADKEVTFAFSDAVGQPEQLRLYVYNMKDDNGEDLKLYASFTEGEITFNSGLSVYGTNLDFGGGQDGRIYQYQIQKPKK